MKLNCLAFLLIATTVFAQSDYTRSPNSFIFDKNIAAANHYGGLYIPVKKAYDMWAGYKYLKTGGTSTSIPAGTQSANMVWEDVPGLISNVALEPESTPDASKIKVNINPGMGSGNAVIAFKVNGNTYWSWHVWVTDDPSNGVNYSQGYETNIDRQPVTVQYMDRNLGASSADFIGKNWQKSGGIMYQWGRKDPFPPMVDKDGNFYEINSEIGPLKHPEISAQTIPVVIRPYDAIEKNIQYSVQNPLTYIINSDNANWFSSNMYSVPGSGTSYITWDLWADNYRGGNSNGSSGNAELRADSWSYELKSELDPCPDGWRVPSNYGRVALNNNLSPWGRKNSGGNDDSNAFSVLKPDEINSSLNGIKVYPGFGMDFTNAMNGDRNIGLMPVPGDIVYYPNSVATNAPVGAYYQDQFSNGKLWSATFTYDGARGLLLTSDPGRTNTIVGLHSIYINQTFQSKTGSAVRCMKDPNVYKIGSFPTQYFTSDKTDFRTGLNNANTYMITNGQSVLRIPVNKAFAIYNQLFSDQEMLPSDHLVAKVLWATNPEIAKSVKVVPNNGIADGYIEVKIDPTKKGSFVVSLHNGSTLNPAYWSWLIWLPNGNPASNPVKYITELPLTTNGNFVNATVSDAPPLVTTLMDRNLGSVEFFRNISSTDFIQRTKGLLFQWGRKDALPSFTGITNPVTHVSENIIYLGSENQSETGSISFTKLTEAQYLQQYTAEQQTYNTSAGSKYQKIKANMLYSAQNPMTFMYKQGTGALYDGGNQASNDTSQIRDWVSDDKSQAENRWGHGTEKSPFDPCPEGWRVPDVSLTYLYTSSKGNSPFYNGYKNDYSGKPGLAQNLWNGVTSAYSGTAFPQGYSFTDAAYPIGNYSADGIRGELGGNAYTTTRTGIWTAAMADLHTGYALAMLFQGQNMQTGAGNYPQAAMSVRCAKDEPRISRTQVNYINQPYNPTPVASKVMINPTLPPTTK